MAPSERARGRLGSATCNVEPWIGDTLPVQCLVSTFGQVGVAAAGKLEPLRASVVPVEADRSVANRRRSAAGFAMVPNMPSTPYSFMPTKLQWTCFRL